MKKYKAAMPISAYPFHMGHVDLFFRAQDIFGEGKVLILVCNNSNKSYEAYDRMAYFKRSEQFPARYCKGLVADFCKSHKIDYIVRGCRNSLDFAYEEQLSLFNAKLGVSTVILPTRDTLRDVSSTAIRELLKYGKLDMAFDKVPYGMRPYLKQLQAYLQKGDKDGR